MARRLFLIVSLCMIAGCAQQWAASSDAGRPSRQAMMDGTAAHPSSAPTPGNLSARDAAVTEAVLRDRLRTADAGSVIFISVGSIRTGWKDPPADILKRLADLPFTLKSVSQARLPRPNEMESPDRYRGVEDPATGKEARIYWAEVKEWISDTKARVDVGVWSGPLGGGGTTCTVEMRDGKWVIEDSHSGWVS